MKPVHLPLTTMLLISSSLLQASPGTQGAPSAAPPGEFRIMSDQEIAEHKAKMTSLQGSAREEYRNAQYEKLKQRARAQGYQLPETPPWGSAEAIPETSAAKPENGVSDMMNVLIKEQKQVVEQAIQAAETGIPATAPASLKPPEGADASGAAVAKKPPVPQVPPAAAPSGDTVTEKRPLSKVPPTAGAPVFRAPETVTPETPPPTSVAPPAATVASGQEPAGADERMETYREQMRNRFDDFMQQREERQQARQAERQREQAQIEARRREYKERVEARRQAAQQRQAPAMQPMPQMPYQQGYAPGYPTYYPPYGYPVPRAYPPRQ